MKTLLTYLKNHLVPPLPPTLPPATGGWIPLAYPPSVQTHWMAFEDQHPLLDERR